MSPRPTAGVDSPFDVLGVDADADEDEIDRAYRRRVKEAHPDHGGSADEFRAVRAAYEDITQGRTDSAYEYDTGGPSGTAASGASGGARAGARAEAGQRAESNAGADSRARGAGNDAAAGSAEGTATANATATVEYLDYEAVVDHGWDIGDDDLFEKAAAADLEQEDYGELTVSKDEALLESAESEGLSWPYACRGSACANCAVAVIAGEMSMPGDHVLDDAMVEEGIRLSCAGKPRSDELRVVINVKHLPGLDELRLPADRFEGSF